MVAASPGTRYRVYGSAPPPEPVVRFGRTPCKASVGTGFNLPVPGSNRPIGPLTYCGFGLRVFRKAKPETAGAGAAGMLGLLVLEKNCSPLMSKEWMEVWRATSICDTGPEKAMLVRAGSTGSTWRPCDCSQPAIAAMSASAGPYSLPNWLGVSHLW